jgi:hypothetical protein
MPGVKQQMILYLPVKPEQSCLCGSGQPYGQCCQPKPDWQPICYNPGAEGYSLLLPQEALFKQVDGLTLRQRLDADPRLAIVDDTPEGGFWILWGDPALESEFGIICFGDIELIHNRELLVTAMSDLRMQTLLDLLQEIADDCLSTPQLQKDPPPVLHKPPRHKARKRFFRRSRR